jgi:hypothetical protein
MPQDEGAIRIAIAGDWGTEPMRPIALLNVYGRLTRTIRSTSAIGDDNEVDENFLGIKNPNSGYAPCRWPEGRHGAFALNGNHEMYGLGRVYFQKILPALGVMREGRNQGQKASFFAWRMKIGRSSAWTQGIILSGYRFWNMCFDPIVPCAQS